MRFHLLALVACVALLSIDLHAAAGFGVPVMIEDINPGPASSSPQKLLSLGTRLFFAATDGTSGIEPMVSEGTAASTGLLRDLWPGPLSGMQTGCPTCNAIAIGPLAYFSATDDAVGGSELWRSDGTVLGTQKLYAAASASDLVAVGGVIFFAGVPTGSSTAHLFTSDGTGPGTVNVNAPTFLSGQNMAEYGGHAYFPASGGGPVELWRSDGSALGTYVVSAIGGGSSSAHPSLLTPVGGRLFFAAYNGTGPGLCVTDGSLAGTSYLKQVRVGVLETVQGQIVDLDGIALFIGEDAAGGYELWRSDGTPAGTERVKDVFPGTRGGLEGSSLVVMGDAVYFAADDGVHARELWRSDGTAAGTTMVRDINPQFGAFGPSSPAGLANVGGTLFFRATSGGVSGTQPWISDGTELGTVQLGVVYPGGSSQADGFIEVNGTVYFSAADGVHGVELWGVSAATVGVPPRLGPPRGTTLSMARPNPVRDETRFAFSLASTQRVQLELLDLQGRVVRILADGEQAAGTNEVALDGRALANGVYLVRLATHDGVLTRKVLVAR